VTRRRAGARCGTAIILLASIWVSAVASAAEIGPGPGWCRAIEAVPIGDEAVLLPGEYPGGCVLRRGGAPRVPRVVRAKSAAEPPRVVFSSTAGNALSIEAAYVVLRGLHFGATPAGTDAIRIYAGHDIVVEDCVFADIGGSAVAATHASVWGVTVRGNRIARTGWTALYFGCHDGRKCRHLQLDIGHNLIHGVTAADDDIGAGIQVKLNSTVRIRDNAIVDTQGPGIMVYGADGSASPSVIERNFVARSATSSGIVVGGGPAVVRNNVAMANVEGGIALENYGRRDLLRGLTVVHNSIYGNQQGGIIVPIVGRVQATVANNAVHAGPGKPTFPVDRAGITSVGNVDCTSLPCFVRPQARDFSPLLLGPGRVTGDPWMPLDDYFGRRRGIPPVAGAIEQPAGPIPLEAKRKRE
jgi:hypothetical protein